VGVEGRVAGARDDEVDQGHGPVLERDGGRQRLRRRRRLGHPGQSGHGEGRPDAARLELAAAGQSDARPVGAQLQAAGLRVEQDLRAGVRGGAGQRLPELAVAAPGVEEDALAGAAAGQDARQQLARRAGRDPAPGLLAGQLGGLEAPELARVGEVEALAEGRAERGAQDLVERVGPRPTAKGGERRVAQGAGRHRRRQAAHEVERAQGEGDPAAAQADAPVPGPSLEVVAEQGAQLGQDARLDGGVEAVAAQVDPHAGDRVAGRGPADPPGPLDKRHAMAVPGRAVGRAHPGRARPQDQQVGRRQPPAGTAAPSAAAAG
jgi:hypothetical protein